MIHIDRKRKDARGILTAPTAKWSKKAVTARAQAIADGPGHEVSDLYKDVSVRVALDELFHGKCAYCEQCIRDTEWEVEHFRPKGRNATTGHMGYYWLAYTWENLLPACARCNKVRRDPPTYADRKNGETAGKGVHFPIAAGTSHVSDPAIDVTNERPLLLNPCVDQPEDHIQFDVMGGVQPRNRSQQGDSTIQTVFLKRRTLTLLRHAAAKEAVQCMTHLVEARAKDNKLAIAHAEQRIAALKADSHVFAAVARDVERDPAAFGIGP